MIQTSEQRSEKTTANHELITLENTKARCKQSYKTCKLNPILSNAKESYIILLQTDKPKREAGLNFISRSRAVVSTILQKARSKERIRGRFINSQKINNS